MSLAIITLRHVLPPRQLRARALWRASLPSRNGFSRRILNIICQLTERPAKCFSDQCPSHPSKSFRSRVVGDEHQPRGGLNDVPQIRVSGARDDR